MCKKSQRNKFIAGTHVGDPEELNTITEVFCNGRNRPLHIGSVKSNIGHNEPAAGVCGIIKVYFTSANLNEFNVNADVAQLFF